MMHTVSSMTSAYMAYLHWTRLALEATLDTLRVAPSTRTSLLQHFEEQMRHFLGVEGDGDDNHAEECDQP